MWKRFKQPLTVKQTVTTVFVVLLAGAAVYGACYGVAALWHRRGVQQSIPAALAGVRAQREELIRVIEAYKAHFGVYPPMFTATGPNRGIINPLCYELLGARFEPAKALFYVPTTKDGLSISDVQKYFNVRSFSNSLPWPATPTNFLANRPLAVEPLTEGSELLGVGLNYTDFTPERFWYDYDFTPWRYNTNPAEHNPGKFDLWVEITVAGKHFTIGNWPDVK